jgi:hypothetical protein
MAGRTNRRAVTKTAFQNLPRLVLLISRGRPGAHLQGEEEGRSSGEGEGKERVRDEPVCPSKPQSPLSSVTYVQDEDRDYKVKKSLCIGNDEHLKGG